jgi:hypothetical protein
MKILVVGSVPPPLGGHRGSLLAEVLRLRREGHGVEIFSLDRLAAAHRYLAGPGLATVVQIGVFARRADAVIVQLEPGLPVRRSAGRSERRAVLSALAAILRRCPDVTLRLCQPSDLPGGLGGRAALGLWKAAGRIEVGNEEARAELAGLLGPLDGRLSSMADAPIDPGQPVDAGLGGWGDGADATASRVFTVVRARAAAQRESLASRARLGVPGAGLENRVPQWQWLPAPDAGVGDLGPFCTVRSPGGHGLRRAVSARSVSVRRSLRQAAMSVMVVAERGPVTGSLVHLVRLALVELRSAFRSAS